MGERFEINFLACECALVWGKTILSLLNCLETLTKYQLGMYVSPVMDFLSCFINVCVIFKAILSSICYCQLISSLSNLFCFVFKIVLAYSSSFVFLYKFYNQILPSSPKEAYWKSMELQ